MKLFCETLSLFKSNIFLYRPPVPATEELLGLEFWWKSSAATPQNCVPSHEELSDDDGSDIENEDGVNDDGYTSDDPTISKSPNFTLTDQEKTIAIDPAMVSDINIKFHHY